ncbi:ethanolamine ammonia-lyase reactivating factor EutA [Desulfotruncus alcoholivorax]|uniref:ethanolamine ammonia-lyase reactivating factor EutA n=1 Tax=Desulfotruncus alcoholivorax TaxID=265477 RepID=UPI000414E213|nr:ethanolamine ammonia-lyase reactivating factor EutA [Desulfotruncus alcoholivorax]
MSSDYISLNSIGIDIGTTTTQVIFSRLQVANTLPQYMAPRQEIVGREILYRGRIHFTPLLDPFTIDPQGIKALVNREFRQAGLNKTDIHTGAVIITGQSAKKK